jgi:hypothetical protein
MVLAHVIGQGAEHVMNRYGLLAQRHMREHLPHRYGSIRDPDRYFTNLGREISNQVTEVAVVLAGRSPRDESYMARAGRLRMAHLMAERRVLAEMAFLAPEGDRQPCREEGAVETT